MNELITASLKHRTATLLFRVPDEMLDEFEHRYIKWIRDYVSRYGELPTVERFSDEHRYFVAMPSADPIEDVFDRTIKRKKNLLFVESVNAKQKELREGADPTPLVHRLDSLFRITSGDVLSSRGHDRLSYFDKRNIFQYGFSELDDATGGAAFGDYVLIVGRPGSYKTTLVEWLLVQWALCGMKVLYISNENPSEEVLPKLDAFFGGFNPMRLRDGAWTKADHAKLRAVEFITQRMDGEIVVPSSPALTVEDVIGYIDSYKPDLVFIDGIYLMNSSGKMDAIGWEETAAVSRSLKRLARKRSIPIFGTIQANRKAEGGMVERDTIAATDAFLQDADCILSINRIGDRSICQIVKNRWGPTLSAKTFEIVVDFDLMVVSVKSEMLIAIEETEW